jgi:hypothetical protein
MTVAYRQSVQAVAGKSTTSGTLQNRYLLIEPAEVQTFNDYKELVNMRFLIPNGSTDMLICTGTVSTAKLMIIMPELQNLDIKIVNANGTSQNLTFLADRRSILHTLVTGIFATNLSGADIEGDLTLLGD